MKTIKIFLASSEELDYDRNVFGNLVRRLDDLYEKRGIRIKLFEWEDYDAAYNDRRKQDEYNDKVRESDLFFVLFYKKAGKFSIEEFDVASEEYKEHASPKIFIFCKDLQPGEEQSTELAEFKKRLFDEIGHYWCRYDSRESLQLQFVMQLQLVENSHMSELKVEDGNVKLNGMQIASMDKLRFAASNEDYVKISEELAALPEKIEKSRLRLEKYPCDEDLKDDLQQKLNRYNKLKEEFEQFQQLLFNTAKRVAQLQGQQTTKRMRRAMDAFCEGHVHEANIILDDAELDAERNYQDYNQSKETTEIKRQTVINSIEELRLKARTFIVDTSIPIDKRITVVISIYDQSEKMAQNVGYEEEKLCQLLMDYALFPYEYGHYKDAIMAYLRLLPVLEKLKKENIIIADTFNKLGKVYYYYGDYPKSLEYYFKSLEIRKMVSGEEQIEIAELYNNIGLAYHDSNTLDYYFKALKIREKILGIKHPETATTNNNIGAMYQRQGEYQKALEYHFKALEIREEVLGTEHPHTAFSYNNIGAVYYCLGDYSKAMEYHLKALKIREKVLGKEHPFTASSYGHIGKIYCKEGRYKKALEYHFKDLYICKKMLGLTQPDTAFPYNNIGVVYCEIGDYSMAMEYLNKALVIRESALGKNHIDTATTYNDIGTVFYKQGDLAKALEYFAKALKIRIEKIGNTHPDTIKTKECMEEVKQKMNSDVQ